MNRLQKEVIRELTRHLRINNLDDFNSLIEYYPTVAQSIENTLEVTKGELRKYVGDGNTISNGVIVDCILNESSYRVTITKLHINMFNLWKSVGEVK